MKTYHFECVSSTDFEYDDVEEIEFRYGFREQGVNKSTSVAQKLRLIRRTPTGIECIDQFGKEII